MTMMKLSDAIRLGAMLRPQVFGSLFDGKGTCAIGAAMEAMGLLLGDLAVVFAARVDFVHVYGDIFTAPCPACGRSYPENQMFTLAHLNDDHHWTRERIADWVETIEPQEQARSVANSENPVSVAQSGRASGCGPEDADSNSVRHPTSQPLAEPYHA